MKLDPLPKDAFDGEKETAPIPRDIPLPKKCLHKNAYLVTSHELKCPCGAGWNGYGVTELHKAFTNQP